MSDIVVPYSTEYDLLFLKRLKKLRKNNPELYLRLKKKMEEILQNPEHYKPLRNILKGKRRAHVGSFVVIFSINEVERVVIFLDFDHHDEVYGN